ncbi:uncharacterized protein [Procambarus clarkii]|uniref:uncharacterized protein isoform X1 n=1 Tax=Procambarus clarkii TaxID=6728 RepID=UPI001E678E8A|nr:uncharacterized protein LOC123764266 isoform X1 [Procambarus clarkii]
MSSQGETYYFKVENVTIYDLFDWALERQDSGEIVVSRKMVNWENRVSRSPSRKATLRTGCLVKVNEQEVALFRLGDIVYAISEHCPHSGGPLHIGDIEALPDRSLCVRCPYHGWKFNLVTGKCHHPKTRQDLSAMVYPVKVNPQNGEIAIGFNEFNPFYFKTPLA